MRFKEEHRSRTVMERIALLTVLCVSGYGHREHSGTALANRLGNASREDNGREGWGQGNTVLGQIPG